MMKTKLIAALCAVLMLLAGCAAKDDFIDVERPQPVIAENVEMSTEFSEYDGEVEKIYATVKNNGNKNFTHGSYYFLQKLDGNEWRYLGVSGRFDLLAKMTEPGNDSVGIFQLKDHVKLPLLPGKYRIGWWSTDENDAPEPTPVAEFTVK